MSPLVVCVSLGSISIHALRGEGDNYVENHYYGFNDISIHALRGEGDLTVYSTDGESTISIHALRGEGDFFI